jgi:hypothetical protein
VAVARPAVELLLRRPHAQPAEEQVQRRARECWPLRVRLVQLGDVEARARRRLVLAGAPWPLGAPRMTTSHSSSQKRNHMKRESEAGWAQSEEGG